MNIITAKWADKERTALIINGTTTVPWPCQTWHSEAIEEWLAENDPAPYETLDEAKARKTREINASREADLAGGVSYNGHMFDSDARSRSNVVGTVAAITAGIPLPIGFTWRTASNVDVPMTEAQMVALGGALLAHVNAAYARSWQRKAEIEAATSISEVDAVTW